MSPQNLITCPHCGHQFSLSDVQKHELEEMKVEMSKSLKVEMQKDFDERARTFAAKVKADAEEQAKKQTIELESLRKRDEEARRKEIEFFKKSQEFEQIQKNQAFEIEKAKSEERKRVEEESKKQAEEKSKFETDKMRLDFDKKESELRKQLEMTQKAVEDANRKANQWSMQIQWEVREDALKELLAQNFPIDIISDVEKGIKWADIIQEVRNDLGQSVGIIAWESKNTKAWSDSWVEKLKEDRLIVNASLSILVSAVMPKWIEKFGLYNGVWVVEWNYVPQIAMILRSQLIEVASIQNSLVGRDERLENVFNYLTSPKFHDKITNILSAFHQMQEQVAEERRAFESRWRKREDLLEKVIKNTAGMHGDLKGMLGSQLGTVEYLELGDGL